VSKVSVYIYPRPFSNGLGFVIKQQPSCTSQPSLHTTTTYPHPVVYCNPHRNLTYGEAALSYVRSLVNNTVITAVSKTADRDCIVPTFQFPDNYYVSMLYCMTQSTNLYKVTKEISCWI